MYLPQPPMKLSSMSPQLPALLGRKLAGKSVGEVLFVGGTFAAVVEEFVVFEEFLETFLLAVDTVCSVPEGTLLFGLMWCCFRMEWVDDVEAVGDWVAGEDVGGVFVWVDW